MEYADGGDLAAKIKAISVIGSGWFLDGFGVFG